MKKQMLWVSVLLVSIQATAQVKTNFNNGEKLTNRGKFNKAYSFLPVEITAPDLASAFRREAAQDSLGSKVFFIAEPIPVGIDVSKLSNWIAEEGSYYGKFVLKAAGAKTLSINFSNFSLPKGTEMFIYNRDAAMITGVITDAENNKHKIWGSSIYQGDELTIEIKLPIAERENLTLLITNIAYGYKDIFVNKIAGFGQSGACNINVLCPQGNNWVPERNTVAFIARSNGAALCSGAMIMNTCSTNIPYLLTADHCFQGDGNVAGWRVFFQAWSATCTPSQNSDGVLFNGATLRSNWAPSDFCLVELNQVPAANSGIHYAGWARGTNAATSGVGIHHPSGDVMKISTYTTPLVREDNPARCNVNPVGQLQWVVQWNQGVTEGGSSGSPLFDQNHRIVGQLSGGPSACTQSTNCRLDMYGRFDNSWTGGGTNATRLSNWLDPLNTGAVTTNTTNIAALQNYTLALAITGANDLICNNGASATYTLTGAPSGANIVWSISNTAIASLSASGNQATVTKNADGMLVLTATIVNNNCINNNIATRSIILGKPTPVDIIGMSPGISFSAGQYVTLSIDEQAISYNWSVAGGAIIGSNTGQSIDVKLDNCFFGQMANNDFSATVSYQNTCGSSFGKIETAYAVCDGNSSPEFRIKLTPNPAKRHLYVEIENEQPKVKLLPQSTMVQYELYDAGTKGIIKRWVHKNDQNKRVFNVQGIKKGLYILRITKAAFQQSVKVIIE
jgi:lysyl endopeptidase